MSQKSKSNWSIALKILSYVATAIAAALTGNSIPPITNLF